MEDKPIPQTVEGKKLEFAAGRRAHKLVRVIKEEKRRGSVQSFTHTIRHTKEKIKGDMKYERIEGLITGTCKGKGG